MIAAISILIPLLILSGLLVRISMVTAITIYNSGRIRIVNFFLIGVVGMAVLAGLLVFAKLIFVL